MPISDRSIHLIGGSLGHVDSGELGASRPDHQSTNRGYLGAPGTLGAGYRGHLSGTRIDTSLGHGRSIGPFDQLPVGPEYSCSLGKIDMVMAVDDRDFNNVAGLRCSYGTTVRRIAIQGLVCSPRMVVIQIRRHKSLEMHVGSKYSCSFPMVIFVSLNWI